MSWDDIAALVYLLRRPDIDMRAITVSGTGLTHCRPGVAHVRSLVAYVGHSPVPVACGSQHPLEGALAFPDSWRTVADSFFGLDLPPVPAPPNGNETAVQLLDRVLVSSPKTEVIELAPMTNLAEALLAHPGLRPRVQMVYAMAGALDVPGNETMHQLAEYNVYVDAKAADVVLRSGIPVTLVPLDATDDLPVTSLFYQALVVAERPGGSEVVSLLLSNDYYLSGSQYFWDPAAAVLSTDPSLGQVKIERVGVVLASGTDHGRTVRASTGSTVHVAMNMNAAGFYQEYLRGLTGDAGFKFTVPNSRLDLSFSKGAWSVSDAARRASGLTALRVSNSGTSMVEVAVGRLDQGHTARDVDAAIRAGVSAAPNWFHVVLDVTVPQNHAAIWGIMLRSGLCVVVGAAPGVPVRRLASVQVL
jgi:pyrimidine-specific ribonucleoside hydrolase